MKIKVEVEIFPDKKRVEVDITSDDLRELAERKVFWSCMFPSFPAGQIPSPSSLIDLARRREYA